jgi:hypothetical protein
LSLFFLILQKKFSFKLGVRRNEWIKQIQKAVQEFKENKTLLAQNKGSGKSMKHHAARTQLHFLADFKRRF